MDINKQWQQITARLRSLLGTCKKPKRKTPYKPSHQLKIEQLLGAEINNPSLYLLALTHRSYEGVGASGSNERLEYLGDSVVSLAVSQALYELYPEEPEGTLTSIRSYLVSRKNMNATAERMGLDQLIRADASVSIIGNDIMGNTLEALVGAIYLDKGFPFSRDFVRSHLIVSKNNVRVVAKKEEDYKTELIILLQKNKIAYDFTHIDTRYDKDTGFVHRCELVINFPSAPMTTIGVGTSKKQSHQNAAKEALRRIEKTHVI